MLKTMTTSVWCFAISDPKTWSGLEFVSGVLNVHISMRLFIQKGVLETILHLVLSPKTFL
jgi:hypothetical protein